MPGFSFYASTITKHGLITNKTILFVKLYYKKIFEYKEYLQKNKIFVSRITYLDLILQREFA